MDKLEFTKQIDAPRSAVWNALWDDKTYPQWTTPFSGSSHAVSDWKQGSEIRFVDGEGSGMLALIDEKIPDEYMSFVMTGMILGGKEVREGELVDQWKGGKETYTLREKSGGTELYVELSSFGMPEDMIVFFKSAWPKALDKLEELATAGQP